MKALDYLFEQAKFFGGVYILELDDNRFSVFTMSGEMNIEGTAEEIKRKIEKVLKMENGENEKTQKNVERLDITRAAGIGGGNFDFSGDDDPELSASETSNETGL